MQEDILCVECGKKKIFKNGVCTNCFIKNTRFTKGPEIIDIHTCPTCSAYKYKNTWLSESFNKIMIKIIKDVFQISNELKQISIVTNCDRKDKKVNCKIEISGFIDDLKITEQHDVNIRLKVTICDVCSKQYGGYYEAIIQIRANKRKLLKDEIKIFRDIVEKLVKSIQSKGNRGLFITDFIEEHGGIDFYLSEKGSAFTIVKKIQEKYGGEIKKSSTSIGMKDSKQIYRMTYLLRIPEYRTNDFIGLDNSFYQIISINKNKVHVIDIRNWSNHVFDRKDLYNAKIYDESELIKEMILVSQSKDEVQIMDPGSYKTFDIKKPMKVDFKENMIKIVKLEEKIFLLPENNNKKKTK